MYAKGRIIFLSCKARTENNYMQNALKSKKKMQTQMFLMSK